MADDEAQSPETPDNTALLEEIRANYQYASDYWREAREQRAIDMRYLQGDPWDPKDRKAREGDDDQRRPCISHDELNQYVNQAVNQVRQNKRGIKVEPAGNGASDKSAEFRQGMIRAIEYRSMAPSIYAQSFQDMVEGSYGFFRISRRYVADDSDDQEIVVKPIPNPDSVLYSPDAKEPDWSDAPWCFVIDPMPTAEFKRRFPDAQKKDFTTEDQRQAANWITDRSILVAEYWRVERQPTGKKTPGGRVITKTAVVQYITNGIEILETNPQPGKEIPIPALVGQQRWVDDGSGPKRKINSLVRFARDPQMSLAFLCSQEMEEAGLTPKTPYVGYTGQFETDLVAWQTATRVPHAFLQVDPKVDGSSGEVLPLPRREQFTPNFQQYELAKDSCRRAIQAAIGSSPLPTAAQRDTEKSGVALDRISTEQSIGSYHFIDGFDRAIARAGRIVESWIQPTYDTEREIPFRKPNEKHLILRINTAQPYPHPETGQPVQYVIGDGVHDTTVSSGPSYESQRREVSEFLDTLIANLAKLPLQPAQAQQLFGLAIKMKHLGPLGDEMAEIISPQGPNAAAAAGQQLAQLQQQLGESQNLISELKAELDKLALEKAGKIVDNEYKLTLEKLRIEADAAKAEITTKAQILGERIKWVEDLYGQLHQQAHEAGLQAAEHANANAIADRQQQAAPPEAAQAAEQVQQ